MSLTWLFFASLTVVGSVAYNIGMKLGGASANALGFVLSLNVVLISLVGLSSLIAKHAFKVDVLNGMNAHTFKYAALCGGAAALIDICYFLALRYGQVIPTQVVWTVGGLIAVSTVAAALFGETLSITKALGIAFGIVSVLLITKA